ncbi:hypothetical protein SAMN05443248_5380 [Bradyrhizobium erythrophlei]|uniref:Uncharacterized protein n=1 Tax=Bradyrhizobium erythrophlei TaxID=1437360 RepID=A0A1M5UCZ0_9BRAD|nr:hypothetical protein SAMN05443248_5380 [Bradyrhizobium erythrophlei]
MSCSDAGTAQVRLCLPCGFDTRHSKPWVGTNVDKSSLPGLTRQSIFERNFLRRWMPGSSPGMTSVFCVHANLNFKQQTLFANTPPRSRRMSCARFGLLVSPSAIRGRRECRAPDAPESRVCRGSGRTHTRSQVTPESPGIPRAMVYGLYRALPGDRLSCHRRRRSCLHRLDTSVGVSGPHVFAVRLRHPRQEHHPRPPHPVPRW